MELAIVTPSYLGSSEEAETAKKSLNSLNNNLNEDYPHFVVDDIPRKSVSLPGGFRASFPIPQEDAINHAEKVYNRRNITKRRRFETNSITATLDAVRLAKDRGADLIFIHLDDNIYVERLGNLIEHSLDAFQNVSGLQWIRLTGVPILSDDCNPIDGNMSCINISDKSITFDQVELTPLRKDDYTLWWSDIHPGLAGGDYWPISAWSVMYRTEFLERILQYDDVLSLPRLGHLERYYKNNWNRISGELEGKFGYINMQFVGLEMDQNDNWSDLISYPNQKVL